jgi:hypothetical protein
VTSDAPLQVIPILLMNLLSKIFDILIWNWIMTYVLNITN